MHATDTDTAVRGREVGLAVDDWGRSDDRAPLVLLHGLTFNRAIWRPIVARLQRIDSRTAGAVDRPARARRAARPAVLRPG